MELKDFCEICINADVEDTNCRACATAWTGKGSPPHYQVKQLSLNAATRKLHEDTQAFAKGAMNERLAGVSISAYRAYTKESAEHRIKLLSSIIAYAVAELNSISKEGTPL